MKGTAMRWTEWREEHPLTVVVVVVTVGVVWAIWFSLLPVWQRVQVALAGMGPQ
jgi:hypothetical protein